jgi:hypothetical protein
MPEPTQYPPSQSPSQSSSQSYAETAAEFGEAVRERGSQAAAVARDTVKDHPVATLAVIGGLAFAVGALWKIGQSRQRSPIDSLLGRLSDLQAELPRRWKS